MLRTWHLVGISDRDDGCITRLFFVWCFTAVWVHNYVTVAIVFHSNDCACISGIFSDTPPPGIEQIPVLCKNWSVSDQYDTSAYKNDSVIFCLFLPISTCHVGPQHGCFENPANENDKCTSSFFVQYVTDISRLYTGIYVT